MKPKPIPFVDLTDICASEEPPQPRICTEHGELPSAVRFTLVEHPEPADPIVVVGSVDPETGYVNFPCKDLPPGNYTYTVQVVE